MQNYYQVPLSPRTIISQNLQNINQSPRHYQQVPVQLVQQTAQVVDLKQYESKWIKKIQKLEDELHYSQQKASYLEVEYEELAKEAQNYKEEIKKLKQGQCDRIEFFNKQDNNTISTALESDRRLEDKDDNYKDQIIELQKMIIKLQKESSQNKIEAIKWKNKFIDANKQLNELQEKSKQ